MPDTLASIGQLLEGLWLAGQAAWGEGTANFEVIRKWNKALVYAKTVAAFAEKLDASSARAEQPRR